MPQLFKNNVSGVLSAGINASQTAIALVDASNFPSPTGGDFFLATLIGLNGNGQESSWEIVRCTARATNTLTVVRAQEGTTGVAWGAATTIQMRVTAGAMLSKTGDTMTGNLTIANAADSRLNLQVDGVTEGILTASATNVRLSSANAIPITIGTNGVTRVTFTGTGFITTGASEYVGIGQQAGTNNALRVARNLENGTTAFGVLSDGTFQAGVTGTGAQYRSVARTAAAAFTMASLHHYQAAQATLGAGSAITIQSGFVADSSLVGATTNYGFYGAIPSGTGRYNLFMEGAAQNYFAGNVGIGQTVPAAKLDVSGSQAGNIVAVGALNIDCSAGNYFTKTINANSTFTVSNVPASRAFAFTLELTHTSGTVTWFSGVQWPGGTAPTLTTGKVHLFTFVTDDGGTSWRGASQINYNS